jgi:RsiW-degrading membrane proteinase PrsW (M82 family)
MKIFRVEVTEQDKKIARLFISVISAIIFFVLMFYFIDNAKPYYSIFCLVYMGIFTWYVGHFMGK